MLIRALTVGCVLALASGALAQPDAAPGDPVVRYDGHRIVRVEVRSQADLLVMQGIGAEVWACEPRLGPVDFRIPPASMAGLDASGLEYKVVVPNLQKRVDAENARIRGNAGGGVAGDQWYDEFKNLGAISEKVDQLAAIRPDLATRFVVGKSLLGRDIFALRIANDGFDTGHTKPVVLLNATQHAREWIAPMVNVYNADRLIQGYGVDPAITGAVDRADIYLIFVTNPDGYDYTWTTDRFWRKNLRDNGGGSFGVDTNRNWGYQWGSDNGSSGDPNSQVYRGTAPFSEPETQALRDWSLAHPALRAHNDIHSFGQYILEPWGFTPDPNPDADFFLALGKSMHAIIKAVHDYSYRDGPLYTTLYPVSGGAIDWFYGDRGAISVSYELRGPGFDPPPSQIVPSAEETFPATLYHIQATISAFPFEADWTRDGVYDLFDFLAFTNDFNAGSMTADLYGDGVLDLFDFLTFLNAFDAGR